MTHMFNHTFLFRLLLIAGPAVMAVWLAL